MIVLTVVLALPLAAANEPTCPRWTIPAALLSDLRQAALRPLGDRVEVASRPFLGMPYTADAAGEGDAMDPDPPSRYDAFDCLTFVEEVLSLALSADPLYAPAIRDAIRYQGSPSYAARRHSMEHEWIPGLLAAGFASDITARLGRSKTLVYTTTHEAWHRWFGRSLLRLPDERLPVGTWRLDYLDLDEAARVLAHFPPGAIVLALRPPDRSNPIAVTHVGLVVATDSLRIRHASRNGRGLVREDALIDFIRRQRAYDRRPVLGVAVLLPREQGPRVSALLAAWNANDAAP